MNCKILLIEIYENKQHKEQHQWAPNERRSMPVSTADQHSGLEAQIRALKDYCEKNKIGSISEIIGQAHQEKSPIGVGH